MLAERIESAPHNFARGDQRVEIGRRILLQARRQNRRLHQRCRQRRSLQVFDRVEQRIKAAPLLKHALPVRLQPRKHLLFDRLYLLAKPRQRFSANLAQHLRVAPLAMNAARTESSFNDATIEHQRVQSGFHGLRIQPESLSSFLRGERPMRARVAANQLQYRRSHRIKKSIGTIPGGSGIPSASR